MLCAVCFLRACKQVGTRVFVGKKGGQITVCKYVFAIVVALVFALVSTRMCESQGRRRLCLHVCLCAARVAMQEILSKRKTHTPWHKRTNEGARTHTYAHMSTFMARASCHTHICK